jgi:hypothetical protein
MASKLFQIAVAALILGCAGSARATVWNNNDLTTYAQGSWGGDPAVDAGAALLFSKFPTVYGATFGVTVGSSTGYTMSFTDAPSVKAYIPSVGPFAPLNGNVLNPITTSSGAFGGEVLALQFNVDFSDAGLLPGTSGLHFGDLTLANLTGNESVLNGLTVRQFLADMNILLGGGTTTIAISDLGTLPGDVNGSFSHGTVSQFAQDHLDAPPILVSQTPIPAALPLFATSLAALGLLGWHRKRKASSAAA